MRVGGRLLVAGLGLIVAGGVGVVAMLPPGTLDGAGAYLEERRQALRAHIPEVPEVQALIVGAEGGAASSAGAGGTDIGRTVEVLRQGGNLAPRRFVGAPTGQPCAAEAADSRFAGAPAQPAADCGSGDGQLGAPALLDRSSQTGGRFRVPSGGGSVAPGG